jgi:thiol:disulfide interchange protein DsbA
VNVASFMQTYKSFGMNAQVARADKITRDYAIQGTPTVVVGGKYATLAAEPARLLQVVDELIVKARAKK